MLASRLTLDTNNNISILDKSCGVEKFTSELNLAVENEFCRLLCKSHSFALNKDIKFKSNLGTENDICRLEIRESSCDISFEIDTFRLKSWRSAFRKYSTKMACRMYKRDREPSRSRKAKLCRILQKRSKRKYLNLYLYTCSCYLLFLNTCYCFVIMFIFNKIFIPFKVHLLCVRAIWALS